MLRPSTPTAPLDRSLRRGHDRPRSPHRPRQLVWILLPVGAATLLRWKGGDGFTDAGLRPHYRQDRRWYELSSAFYLIAMLAAAAGGFLASHWELHDDWAPLRFAAIAVVALVPFTFTAISKEFGWRGYLTPRLNAAGPDVVALVRS